MHGAHLVGGERFGKQVNGAHLATEHPLLVEFGRGADVALVPRLANQ